MTYTSPLWHHVQRSAMADLDMDWDEVQPDGDGDIIAPGACIRLLEDEGWVRVWMVGATGLRRSAKLLREVNDLKVSIRVARVMLTEGSQLIVAGEVRAESLEPGELGELVRIVAQCAARIGELVQIVHGTPSVEPHGLEV